MVVLLRHARDYMRETTVHGLRYLVEERSIPIKCLWLAAISACFSVVLAAFASSLRDARDSPFITTLDTVPVHEVPFPAVTFEPKQIDPSLRFLQRWVKLQHTF